MFTLLAGLRFDMLAKSRKKILGPPLTKSWISYCCHPAQGYPSLLTNRQVCSCSVGLTTYTSDRWRQLWQQNTPNSFHAWFRQRLFLFLFATNSNHQSRFWIQIDLFLPTTYVVRGYGNVFRRVCLTMGESGGVRGSRSHRVSWLPCPALPSPSSNWARRTSGSTRQEGWPPAPS